MGQVFQSPQCRYPPGTVTSVYGQGGATARTLTGVVEVENDPDLRALIAFQMSETLTDEGVRQLAEEAKTEVDHVVIDKLASTGFLF